MIKKTMLAAFAVALAFAALPALASAMYKNPYLAEKGNAVKERTFTVGTDPLAEGETGYHPRLTTHAGKFVECKTVSGEGEFVTSEEGWIELTFSGECHTTLGIPCTTVGQESGTITTPTLPFHLKTVDHGEKQTPGVLITPGEGKAADEGDLFVAFKCSFAGTVEVGGQTPEENGSTPGIIGTITSPEKGNRSKTATLSFDVIENGTQTHRTVTNDSGETKEYDLKSSFNGGATETAAQEGKGTITFDEGEPELLTTP